MEFKGFKIFLYLGLVLVFVLIAYFLIWLSLPEIKNNQRELIKGKRTVEEKENTLAEFKRVSEKYKKNSKNLKTINQLLLPEPDLPLILIQLEALAAESKIKIQNISFSPLEKSDKGVGILPVSLDAKGSYLALKNFLEAIATNLNIMEVKDIALQVEKKGAPEAVYSFSLKIDVYTQALPKVEAPSPPPPEVETPTK